MAYLQNNPSANRCKLVSSVTFGKSEHCLSVAIQVYEASLGLRYLHHNWVIHGDLKAASIITIRSLHFSHLLLVEYFG